MSTGSRTWSLSDGRGCQSSWLEHEQGLFREPVLTCFQCSFYRRIPRSLGRTRAKRMIHLIVLRAVASTQWKTAGFRLRVGKTDGREDAP